MSDFSMQEWLKNFIGSEPHHSARDYANELIKGQNETLRVKGLPDADANYARGYADALERDIFPEMLELLKPKQQETKDE